LFIFGGGVVIMNILKSISWLLIIFIVVASIFGLTSGLQLLLFCFGLKEFLSAKEYYDNQQKKLAIASVIVGISVCVCAFLSITNII